MQHKWHKEIKAWADGAEIEWRFFNTDFGWTNWISIEKAPSGWDGRLSGKYKFNGDFSSFDDKFELRIKPQQQQSSCCKCQQTCSALKEPQYLYVYKGSIGHEPIFCFARSGDRLVEQNYIGKIKLEQDDE